MSQEQTEFLGPFLERGKPKSRYGFTYVRKGVDMILCYCIMYVYCTKGVCVCV